MHIQDIAKLNPEERNQLIRENFIAPKTARQCEHIKINGEFCGSPALRGRNYCYFHLTYHGSRLSAERQHARALAEGGDAGMVSLELPPLEDAAAIQMALMQVIDAILHNRIDNKRAGLVLYALQTAGSNLARADFEQQRGAVVAGSYDDFEDDFELGDEAPELRADQSEAEEAAEHEAKIAEIEEMAEAYAKLDAARAESRAKLSEADEPDGTSAQKFECDCVSQLFCSIMGPRLEAAKRGVVESIERDAVSQRIRLASSDTEDEEDADAENSAA